MEPGGELDDEDEVQDHLSPATVLPVVSSGTEGVRVPMQPDVAAASNFQKQKQQQEDEEWFSFTSSPVRTSGKRGSGGSGGARAGGVDDDPIVTL